MRKINQILQKLQQAFVHKFNRHFLGKSFKAAFAEAKRIHAERKTKMWIILVNGEFVAIEKQEFKIMWQHNPAMKFRSLEEWKKHVYEFTGDRKQGDTESKKFVGSQI